MTKTQNQRRWGFTRRLSGCSGAEAWVLDIHHKLRRGSLWDLNKLQQDGGLQEIVISYKEGDEYGKKILERIINSVELKNDKE